ncbi:MFS transporter, partial [Actinotalea sp.]|uniref:MFS transporter n=1 Tax=Actinotalea sp. TaxID=1872145 RepID=UPI003566B624
NVGTWMQRVAQDWLVLTVLSDDSGIAVGITTALQFAPVLALSAYAGVLADRLPRRALLITTQAAQGVLALGLGALVLLGHAQLWHVYVFALLLGCVSAIDGPVRMTFVADMVPADKLSNAVGLNSASFNAARLIGPGLAGVLIAWIGTGWVFALNGVSFLATILALTQMRASELNAAPRTTGSRRGQLRAGVAYVRHRSDIVVIMVVVSVISTFGLNFQLTSALMARTVFDKGAGEYGILGSVLAIGSLTGALMAARRERPRVRLVIGSAFGFGISTGLLALMPTYTMFMIACIPVGFTSLTMLTAANSALQMGTEPAMRGRVMALYMVVFLGATPIGSPLVGWIAETYGARWSIGVGSISALLVAGGAALWAERSWRLRVRYHVLRRPHLEVRYLDGDPAIAGAAAREEAARAMTAQKAQADVTAA